METDTMITIVVSGLLGMLVLFILIGINYLGAPGFEYDAVVDKYINDLLDKHEITDIGDETAKIGNIEIWHHRNGCRVITLYGQQCGSRYDRGCTSRLTKIRVFKKMGGVRKIQKAIFQKELKRLENLKNN